MKKRKYFIFTSIIIFFFTLTIFTGCGAKKDEINDNNSSGESNVNTEENNETNNTTSKESIAMEAYQKYLDNKEYANEDFGGLNPEKYVFLDVTNDGIPELFITADDEYKNYSHYSLVLTFDGKNVIKVGIIHSTTGLMFKESEPTHIAFMEETPNSNIHAVKITEDYKLERIYDVKYTHNKYHVSDYEKNIDADYTVDEVSTYLHKYNGYYIEYTHNIDGTPIESKTTTSTTTSKNYIQVGDLNIKYGTYKGEAAVQGDTLVLKADGTATLNGEDYTYKVESHDFSQDSSSKTIESALVFTGADSFSLRATNGGKTLTAGSGIDYTYSGN